MIHFSCDRCKRMIDPACEPRFVVRIEFDMVLESPVTDQCEEDRDYLNEIDQAIEAMDLEHGFCEQDGPLRHTYDLCAECYERVLRDPLAVESSMHFGFSHN
jgi:hypothetical protein